MSTNYALFLLGMLVIGWIVAKVGVYMGLAYWQILTVSILAGITAGALHARSRTE